MPKPGSVLTWSEKVAVALPVIVFLALTVFGLYVLLDYFFPKWLGGRRRLVLFGLDNGSWLS